MSAGEILLWIIFPYAAVTTFVVGTWWRYRADQFGWTSGSTQLFEQQDPRLGRPGVPLRRARRRRRPRHRADDPEVVHRGRRHVRAHLPLVLGDRRRRRRRGLRRRLRRARLPAGHERPRPPHDLADRPARLLPARRADRARLLDDVRAQPDHRRRPTTTATRSRRGGARCSSCSPTSRPSRAPTPSTRCTRSSPGRSGRCSRSAGSCTPGASRCSTSAAPTSSTAAATRPPPAARDERRRTTRAGAGTELALATLAFTACFYAWSLLGPLSPDLQDALDLSDFQTSAMVAVPVLLGSLMRIPLGWLTDRLGGRRVFTALMAFTPLPLIALALWHDSLGADPRRSGSCSASPAPRSRSACRSSTAGTRPSAKASRWASTGWAWAAPCSPA